MGAGGRGGGGGLGTAGFAPCGFGFASSRSMSADEAPCRMGGSQGRGEARAHATETVETLDADKNLHHPAKPACTAGTILTVPG